MKHSNAYIFKLCKSLSEGQYFENGNFNQYVKNPCLITHILENKDKINNLYTTLLNSRLNRIQRTESGAIVKRDIHLLSGAWDCRKIVTAANVFKGVIITVILNNYVFVFKCGAFSVDKSTLTGRKAFEKFLKRCTNHGIRLDDYKITNGKEVKEQIEPPYIEAFKLNKKLEHVHHLDLVSAWPSGVCKDFPEFYSIFSELREKDKLIGDMALGFCQSQYCGYAYAHLAKAGINNCNAQIRELMVNLIKNKFEVIGLNTDGIWYRDKTDQNRIYHDENEGTKLGQWKTDHKDTTYYALSRGQYYFIEDGKLNIHARGFYPYELIKPRDEWTEEDFYIGMMSQANIIWDELEGFIIET